jgi:DNA (cytosine-5)-methyltransferase 1
MDERIKISAVDLFCGIGGLSYGLQNAGIKVKVGIDLDKTCKYTYEANCNAKFIPANIKDIKSSDVNIYFDDNDVKLLVGCAPCQPFSTYTYKKDKQKDERWQLLYEFSRLITEVKPDIVSMENVPSLLNFKKAPVFYEFVDSLKKNGYNVFYKIVYAPDYGIPQKRKRLVLLASRLGDISLISPTHSVENYKTVKDAIGHLEIIKSGETSKTDIAHKASLLSEMNIKRIRQSKPGGSWKKDWDKDLILDCHKEKSGKSYGSIYGRMRWDEPAPTMTTFCTGIGNGRFGHPEQDRAISLREAAILQSFPETYKFAESPELLSLTKASKHVGNAVPPRLGEVIGISIIKHLTEIRNGEK